MLSGVGAPPVAADIIDTSSMKAWEHCALCHGADGNSRMAKFPKLAGQRFEYLVKQLRDFKTATRENDGGPMAGTTEQFDMPQLVSAARYYSALPPPPPVEPDKPLAQAAKTLGKRIFERGLPEKSVPACVSCHGAASPDGRIYPRLEAQHADYLLKQLADFRDGDRTNDPDGLMRGIAKLLSKTETQAVTAYAASLSRAAGGP